MEIKDIVRSFYDSSSLDQSTRKRAVATERHINFFMYVALTSMNLYKIAEMFGRTNHATVIWGLKAVKGLYEVDSTYRRKFNLLIAELEKHGYDKSKIIHQLNNNGSGRSYTTKRVILKSRGVKEILKREKRSTPNGGDKTKVCLS